MVRGLGSLVRSRSTLAARSTRNESLNDKDDDEDDDNVSLCSQDEHAIHSQHRRRGVSRAASTPLQSLQQLAKHSFRPNIYPVHNPMSNNNDDDSSDLSDDDSFANPNDDAAAAEDEDDNMSLCSKQQQQRNDILDTLASLSTADNHNGPSLVVQFNTNHPLKKNDTAANTTGSTSPTLLNTVCSNSHVRHANFIQTKSTVQGTKWVSRKEIKYIELNIKFVPTRVSQAA